MAAWASCPLVSSTARRPTGAGQPQHCSARVVAANPQCWLAHMCAGFISLDASRTWICYWVVHRSDMPLMPTLSLSMPHLMSNPSASVQPGAAGCPAARPAQQGQHHCIHCQLPGALRRLLPALLLEFGLEIQHVQAEPCTSHHFTLMPRRCPLQHPDGGFGGGPYQLAHLAPTYAAVGALVTLGGADALAGAFAVCSAN